VIFPKGFRAVRKIDAVLKIVGNSVLLDSMKLVRRGGHMCLAGFLEGLGPIEFNPLLQMPSGVHFSFFGSFTFGTPEFLLSDVPLQSIIEDVENGILEASPSRVFSFEEIREAHRLMESNEETGRWWSRCRQQWVKLTANGNPLSKLFMEGLFPSFQLNLKDWFVFRDDIALCRRPFTYI
jgi:Zinc-binding dehydrogenase